MNFANMVGQELWRLLARRGYDQLADWEGVDRFSALLSAAVIPIAEILRDPVEQSRDPAATADKLVALAAGQIRQLLQTGLDERRG